jgi:hypothetical protein
VTIDVLDLRSFPPVEPLSPVPDHYRQTLLAKSVQCPRSAYLYTKYDGGALTHPLAGGTVLHRAIERFIRELLKEDERYGIPERAKDILNETLAEATDLTVSPDRFDSMRAMVFHVAEGLVIPNSEDEAEVVCLETPVTVELNGRRITGTIDFAEADEYEVRIRDWKSAFHNVTRPEDEPEDDEYVPTKAEWDGTFQLILYAYALATGSIEGAPEGFNFRGVQRFRLRQDHPRQFWKREGTMAYREAVIDIETLLDWRLYLEAAVEKLDRAFAEWQFPAVWGDHCDFCPASAECPIPAPLRKWRGELRTDEDAARAMVIRERHKQIGDELWASVKGFMKGRGGRLRYGRDRELHFKKSESEKLRRKVTIEGRKMDAREELKSQIERRNAGYPGEIIWEEFYEKSVSTRLTARTLTDAELIDEETTKGTD